jgi:hypothetical protein
MPEEITLHHQNLLGDYESCFYDGKVWNVCQL